MALHYDEDNEDHDSKDDDKGDTTAGGDDPPDGMGVLSLLSADDRQGFPSSLGPVDDVLDGLCGIRVPGGGQ